MGEAVRGWESGLRKERPPGLGTGPTDGTHLVPAGAEEKDGYGHTVLILVTGMRRNGQWALNRAGCWTACG